MAFHVKHTPLCVQHVFTYKNAPNLWSIRAHLLQAHLADTGSFVLPAATINL